MNRREIDKKIESYAHKKVSKGNPVPMSRSHFGRIVRGERRTPQELRIQKNLSRYRREQNLNRPARWSLPKRRIRKSPEFDEFVARQPEHLRDRYIEATMKDVDDFFKNVKGEKAVSVMRNPHPVARIVSGALKPFNPKLAKIIEVQGTNTRENINTKRFEVPKRLRIKLEKF